MNMYSMGQLVMWSVRQLDPIGLWGLTPRTDSVKTTSSRCVCARTKILKEEME